MSKFSIAFRKSFVIGFVGSMVGVLIGVNMPQNCDTSIAPTPEAYSGHNTLDQKVVSASKPYGVRITKTVRPHPYGTKPSVN